VLEEMKCKSLTFTQSWSGATSVNCVYHCYCSHSLDLLHTRHFCLSVRRHSIAWTIAFSSEFCFQQISDTHFCPVLLQTSVICFLFLDHWDVWPRCHCLFSCRWTKISSRRLLGKIPSNEKFPIKNHVENTGTIYYIKGTKRLDDVK